MRSRHILAAALFAGVLIGCGNKHRGVIEASGTIEAPEVKVGAKVPGQIERIYVREGASVKPGDTLLVLDRTTLSLQARQAHAAVELADAQHRLLQHGARTEDIRIAEETVRQAEASFKSASDDLNRMRELLASNAITKKQFDDAEARYLVAQAQLNSARQNLQKMRQFARAEELAAARARLEQARAAADLARQHLKDAAVLAPVEGTVTHLPVEEGELVGSGSTVATIALRRPVSMMIYVTAEDLGKVMLGSEADIVIDTYPDRTFPGVVVYISPRAEFTPKNVQTKEDRTKLVFGVKIEAENREGILKAGMPADAYIK